MQELISAIRNHRGDLEQVDLFEDEYGTTKVYGIETDTHLLKVWNSSNLRSFNKRPVLNDIISELEDGNTDGSVNDDFKEIMFEVLQK